MVDNEAVFFQSIPWCATLLNDPVYVVIPTPSRRPNQSTEDALLADTLKTKTTIPAIITLYERPAKGRTLITEARLLVALEYGVNGYPNIAHGGLIGAIIDESMGILLKCNKDMDKTELGEPVDIDTLVTASLKVNYLQAVMTPQTVLVTAKIEEIKGRKFYMTGTVRDGNGAMLAKAEAMWIGIKFTREKL